MRLTPLTCAIAVALAGFAVVIVEAWISHAAAQTAPPAPSASSRSSPQAPHANNPTPGKSTTGLGANPGPIGATDQTMPAKFSEHNAALDATPTMALPMLLNDDQKRVIYESVMKSQTPEALVVAAPPQFLTPDVNLYDLPGDIQAQIPSVRGYKVVRLENKVLLVSPSNRVVIGEIDGLDVAP